MAPRGKVLIAAGGTGGHLFPALAVADRLRERYPEVELVFVGRADKIEARRVPQAGYRFVPVRAAGLPRKLGYPWIPALRSLLGGVADVRRVLRRERPDVVFGTGGYLSGLVGGLAALRRVPVVLHESNAVPGLANRWLARWAVEVHVGFEAAARYLPPEKVRFSGNPLRPEVLHAAERRGQKPRNDPLRIAIIGGSLGAATLNRAVLQALPELARLPIVLVHQTGERAYPWVMETIRSRWGEVPCNIQVVPFVEQMGELYAQTDLLIARAGAMTLSEAVWCRVPMVLVPYPHAGTDEQRQNARAVAQAGAALLIEDAQFDGSRLVEVVQEFLRRPERLEEMAARCEALARPDATDQIVEAIVAYLPR